MHLKENKGQKRKRKKQNTFTISQLNIMLTTIDFKGKLNYKHMFYIIHSV